MKTSNEAIRAIRLAKRAFITKYARDPGTLYLGHDEYREFRLEIDRMASWPADYTGNDAPVEQYEGMEVIVCAKPGVQVAEART